MIEQIIDFWTAFNTMNKKQQPQYRVIRSSYRDEDTGEVKHRYYLQELKYSWWQRDMVWKNMTALQCYGMDCYRCDISYADEKEALKHLTNLMTPVPEDKVIQTAWEFPEVDNGTLEVTIPTPKGWKCKRKGCNNRVKHKHTTFTALKT